MSSNYREIPALLAAQASFTGNSMDANVYPTGARCSTAALPSKWARRFVVDRPVYVVFSYWTPIAWVCSDGEVVVPDVKYSATTSRHQGLVRTYLKDAA